jgi:carbon-monoxide dehydrogenase medium subunit
MAPPLIALNARAVIAGPGGERVVPLDEFFVGPGRSVLKPGEILRELLVPRVNAMRASYAKLEHRAAMDIAMVGAGVSVQLDGAVPGRTGQAQICEDIRIALGAVAPTPLRAKRAEELLRGQEWNEERIAEAARAAAEEAKPIDDVRSSAWYRREMVEVLTRRQLMGFRN